MQSFINNRKVCLLCIAFIFISCSGNNDEVENHPVIQNVFELDSVYNYSSNGINTVLAKASSNSALDIFLDDRQLTDSDFLEFDPSINNKGDYSWSEVQYSNSESNIYLNDQKITDDNKFHYNSQLSSLSLFWLTFDRSDKTFFLNRANIKNPLLKSNFLLDFIPDKMIYYNDNIYISGFSPEEDRYKFYIYNDLFELLYSYESENSLLMVYDNQWELWEVSGNNFLSRMFYSLFLFRGQQFGEPFSFMNENMGRISWNVSYRLNGLKSLYLVTEDKSFLNYAKQVISKVMLQVKSDGLFYSKKYSIDMETNEAFLVDNAIIYYSIFLFYEYLDHETQESLIEYVSLMYDYFEPEFYENRYHFKKCSPVRWDGVSVPFNQQNAMGLLLLELFELTKNQIYLNRVEKLYDHFISELDYLGSEKIPVWHYWEKSIYNGWSDLDSCYAKNQPEYLDPDYEDIWHAEINIEFIKNYSKNNKIPNVLNIEAISKLIEADYNLFSNRIDGKKSNLAYWYLPRNAFVASSTIRKYYNKWHVSPYVDFDNQNLFSSYAEALRYRDPDDNNTFEIIKYDLLDTIISSSRYHVNFEGDMTCDVNGSKQNCHSLILDLLENVDNKKM